MHRLFIAMAIITLTAPISAEAQKKGDDPKPIEIADIKHDGPVNFQQEVLPILRKNCISCHNKTDAESDLVLETPESILKGGFLGPAAVPKKGAESLLVKVAARQEEPFMPPADNKRGAKPLTPDELGLIKKWIDEGATGEVVTAEAPIQPRPLPLRIQQVLAVAVSPDGSLVAAGRANRISVYDAKSGALLAELADPKLAEQGASAGAAHLDLVQSLEFHPEGELLASSGYRTVKLWRLKETKQPEKDAKEEGKDGKDSEKGDDKKEDENEGEEPATPTQVWQLERTIGDINDPSVFEDRVLALDFSPDGNLLATGGGVPTRSGQLKIFKVEDGKLEKEFSEPHSDTIFDLEFSPDGTKIATAAADRYSKVFTVESGEVVHALEGHTHHVLGVSWQANGARIATSGADSEIKIWEAETGKQHKTVKGHGKEVTAIEFLGKGDEAISCSGDTSVRRVRAGGGNFARTYNGAGDFLHAADVSIEGETVAAGGQSGKLYIWSGNDGKLLHTIEPKSPVSEEEANE